MCDQIISVTFMNLVAPKAGAKDELLFNEPVSADYHNKAKHHTFSFTRLSLYSLLKFMPMAELLL